MMIGPLSVGCCGVFYVQGADLEDKDYVQGDKDYIRKGRRARVV